jgi:hypothetical protein
MRIGGEAPGRRAHSSGRFGNHGVRPGHRPLGSNSANPRQISASVSNSGLIEAEGGSLSLQGGLTNLSGSTLTGGSYKVDAGSTLGQSSRTRSVRS